MNSADLTVAVATAIGILFTMGATTLGLIIRLTIKWTNLRNDITTLQKVVADNAAAATRSADAIYDQMKDDRRATDERLRFLERERMLKP